MRRIWRRVSTEHVLTQETCYDVLTQETCYALAERAMGMPQMRAAWDSKRYTLDQWRAWYYDDADKFFSEAPNYSSLSQFTSNNGLRDIRANGHLLVADVIEAGVLDALSSFRLVGLFFAHKLVIIPLELADRIGYLNHRKLRRTDITHVGLKSDTRMAIYDLLADEDYFNRLKQHDAWKRVDFGRVAVCMYDTLSGRHSKEYDTPAACDDDREFYNFLGIETLPWMVHTQNRITQTITDGEFYN